MKIGRITKTTTQGIEESNIEVDGWKILIGLLSAGLITGLIAAFTFFLIDLPKSNFDREKAIRDEKFEVFNFVLRAESDTIRKNSLLFMLKSGVLVDDQGKLLKIIQDDLIPDWSDMPEFDMSDENTPVVPIPPAGGGKKTESPNI